MSAAGERYRAKHPERYADEIALAREAREAIAQGRGMYQRREPRPAIYRDRPRRDRPEEQFNGPSLCDPRLHPYRRVD